VDVDRLQVDTRTTPTPLDAPSGEPGGGLPEFEVIGVDRVPEHARTSTPWTFSGIVVGSSLAMPLLVYGWLPITFGLSVPAGISAAMVGTIVGIILVIPLILIGSATATNNSTASGAFFGVRGRLVGSVVGIATMLVYTALGIWTGGQIMVALSARLFHTQASSAALAAAYAILAVLVSLVAIYGYHLMVRVEYLLVGLSALTYVLIAIAFRGHMNLAVGSGQYLLSSFWSTWIFTAIACGISGPMSLITIMGDWTRYISPRRYPARRLLPIACGAIFIALMVPTLLGILVTTAFRNPSADFFGSLIAESPTWGLLALAPMAVLGTVGFVATNVYSAALDLDAIVPRLSRAQAAILAALASTAVVFLGSLVWDVRDSITAASFLLVAIGAPWAAVTGIGHLLARGRYHIDDLQVFNRRQIGGVYWFAHGFNARAVAAWTAGAVYGCLAINATPLYVGPLAGIAGGVDTSFIGSAMIASVCYLGLTRAFPARTPGLVPTTTAAHGSGTWQDPKLTTLAQPDDHERDARPASAALHNAQGMGEDDG
jgi:purine-cytosine permease-like protein